MRSEGSVDLWKIRRTLVASSEMQTPKTPSPVPRAEDNDSFKGAGEKEKEKEEEKSEGKDARNQQKLSHENTKYENN